MSKKSFKDNPDMAYISQRKSEYTQDNAQEIKQELTQENIQQDTALYAQEVVQLSRQGYVRTQGRKGYKKPRINLAFDSDELLVKVRSQAEKEGKSITQLINEAIVIYLNNTQ